MFELNRKEPARAVAEPSSARERDSSPTRSSAPASRGASSAGMAVIGRSIQIRGDLRGDEDIRIEGDIEGSIHLPNHCLTIGQEGRVRADAYAKSIIIDGEINGDVYGVECVTLRANARVRGNILASRVSLEEGARFKGSIDMDPESVKAAHAKAQGAGATDGATPQRANGIDAAAKTSAEKPAGATGSAKAAKADATL